MIEYATRKTMRRDRMLIEPGGWAMRQDHRQPN